MNRLRVLARGSRFALVALVLTQAMVLARSALIARALGPEQYGIAATFILLQQFLDSTSDTGLNKFTLSHAQGHLRRMMATIHAISAARAGLVALLLLAVGWPAFHLLGVTSSVLPFAVLAAASLCIGFTHYDGIRMQRGSDLSAVSLGNLAAELASTAAAALLVLVDQSYLVALWVILAKTATAALFSFLLARRPYAIAFDRPSARLIWAFSLPLMINGPVLFFTAQGERLAAAAALPPRELGIYTAALLLIYTPSQLFLRFLGTVFLPELSREVRETGRHGPRFAFVTVAAAVAMAAGFALLGQWLILLFFGERYRLDWLIVAIIGLTQALRFSRVWSSGLALAYGITGQILGANSLRLVMIPLCLLGVWAIGGMMGLAIGALAGEAIALVYANWSVRRALARRSAATAATSPAAASDDLAP
ncbi:lipopolysaccharide biosynthesis protein [Sandarakinorhabdus rubra]|uniref:lipopolysaccharide biosynthesis protein n=1 Tax=Sandarakinorhabdus rubra TaxID=2672568 RepID=UPI0013DA9A6B|nr:oligosaccharide flippase family protein [Sandarakinorhabdus rubra]